MGKIYYVGDWAVLNGPVFAESPFNYSHKGLEVFDYGKWLKTALESNGKHQVNSVPTWDFYKLAPGAYEEILDTYDMLIFSDVEAKLFQLAPHFFDREKFGKDILTFPDRIRLTVEAIENGKKAMFLGGWLSFTGSMGKGGWGRTRLAEVLPVQCLDHEDLVESTEGFHPKLNPFWRSAFPNTDFHSFPPLLGYNKTTPKKGTEVPVTLLETGDPLLSIGAFGKGKVLAFMSDPAPHWGCNFVYWKDYNNFWQDSLQLLHN